MIENSANEKFAIRLNGHCGSIDDELSVGVVGHDIEPFPGIKTRIHRATAGQSKHHALVNEIEKIVSAGVNLSILDRERIDYPFNVRTVEFEIQCPIVVDPSDKMSGDALVSGKIAAGIILSVWRCL